MGRIDLLRVGDVGAECALEGGKGFRAMTERALLGELTGIGDDSSGVGGSLDSPKSQPHPRDEEGIGLCDWSGRWSLPVLGDTDGWVGREKSNFSTPNTDVGREIAAEAWLS